MERKTKGKVYEEVVTMKITPHARKRVHSRFDCIPYLKDTAHKARTLGTFVKYNEDGDMVLYEYDNKGWVFKLNKMVLITVFKINRKDRNVDKLDGFHGASNKKKALGKYIRNKKMTRQIRKEYGEWAGKLSL